MNRRGAQKYSSTALVCAALLAQPSPGVALELSFPGTADLVSVTDPLDGQHLIATGPWVPAGLPTRDAAGRVQEFTWRISGDDITTMGLVTSLQDQIEAQGYSIPFTCFATACGGFDFRHALSVGRPPEMHVDLGDFHYLTALSEDGETEAAVMISRGGETGFVHLAVIQPPSETEAAVMQSTRTPDPGSELGTTSARRFGRASHESGLCPA